MHGSAATGPYLVGVRSTLVIAAVATGSACLAQVEMDHAVFDELVWRERSAHTAMERSGGPPERGFDERYLRCEWTLDPAVRYISGQVMHVFVATAALDQVVLDLSNDLTVDMVSYHGAPIAFEQAPGNVLTLPLPEQIAQGTLDSVRVTYHGVPPSNGFGSFETDTHGPNDVPVLWTLSEPYGAKDWWPCKQDLHDKIDSMDVFVSCPAAFRAAGNGRLVSETEQNGQRLAHWQHRYPIAHYLIATAVTDYSVITDEAHLPADTVPMITYCYPEDEYMAWLNAHADVCERQMPLYASLFGNYPFADEKYGHAQFGWGGGMEHQTMTFVGSYSYELAAHELAHQWFGDKVTCGSWQDIWLNEGFATYLQMLCYRYLAPEYWQGQLVARINSITSEPGGSVLCTDTTDVGRIFSGRLTYNKGAMVLHMLRWVCGDTAWYHGVRSYLDDPELAYNSARTADLQTHLEDASGLDLDGFMSDWFTGEGYPTYSMPWTADQGGAVSLVLYQSASHPSVDFFELPVPVRFKNDLQDTIVVLNNTMNGQAFTFDLPFLPDSAFIDPDHWLITGQNIATAVSDISGNDEDPLLYPVPATTSLTVRAVGSSSTATIRVLDVTGRAVIMASMVPGADLQLGVEGLNAGTYLLERTEAGRTVRKHFVKQ